MDSIVEMAKLFKERENQPYMGPQIGTVISPPPELKVRLGDKIILDKKRLVIAAHVLASYRRAIQVQDASSFSGNTASALEGTGYEHTHTYESLGFAGQMSYTDTLQEGDEVILMPSTDIQTYFLVDKAVKL